MYGLLNSYSSPPVIFEDQWTMSDLRNFEIKYLKTIRDRKNKPLHLNVKVSTIHLKLNEILLSMCFCFSETFGHCNSRVKSSSLQCSMGYQKVFVLAFWGTLLVNIVVKYSSEYNFICY